MSEFASSPLGRKEVAEAFAVATVTALQEMTQTEASVAPSPRFPLDGLSGLEMSARIELARTEPGAFSIVLAAETASRLAERYLPAEASANAEVIDDFVGELANVIAGQAKTMLKGTPYHFGLSIPTVRQTSDLLRRHELSEATLTATIESELGPLFVFVELPPSPGA